MVCSLLSVLRLLNKFLHPFAQVSLRCQRSINRSDFRPRRHLHRRLLASVIAIIVMTAQGVLSAQTIISGDIAGTVTDPSGAAIPGAAVTATSMATGASKTVTAGAAGDYRISLLQPGSYKLSVSASGFQTTQLNVDVRVGQVTNGNLQLSITRGSQTVEVVALAVPLLQSENSDLSTTITMQQIQNLPNPGGDITYPVQTTQGVVMNTQGGYGNSSAFGLPATSNNFTINGAEDNDPFLNLNNSGPSNLLLGSNDVDEVNVVANGYSAQYGSLGGIQENIITRSGSNRFHGNATYYWTNSDLNANDWFNDYTGTPQPFANANQWGAAVGGPIIKDKTFFFANYEGMRFVTSVPSLEIIPSPAYQTAVLANLASVSPAQVPFYQKLFGVYNDAPGAANATPYAGTTWANAFEGNAKNFLPEQLVTARLDQKFGENDSLFAHFKWDHGIQPTHVDPISPLFNALSDQPDYEGQLEETHGFSPNLVNQFLFAVSWYSAVFVTPDPSAAAALFPYNLEFDDGSFSTLGGEDGAFPEGRNVTQYQFNDDVSWTMNRQTFKFGFTMKRDDVTDYDLGSLSQFPLALEFGPASSPAADPTTLPLSGGDLLGNGTMLIGIQNFPTRLSAPIALYNLGFYAQDQWKLSSNFQVTGGVRIEHNSNPVCQVNCFGHLFNTYSSVTANLDTPYNSVIAYGLHQTFNHLQAVTVNPRFGFTWSPNGHPNTVLRGGFGLFTDIFPATVADDLLSNAPLNVRFDAPGLTDPSQPGSFTNALVGANKAFVQGFASGGTYDSISATDPNFAPPVIFNADNKIHYPTYEEYSLQIQQQIGRSTSFQIGYVGNHGYHEPVVNNGVNVYGFGGAPATPLLPAFSVVEEVQSVATSNYSGLVMSVRNQSKYLTLQFNYTYSHALDEISNGGFLPFGLTNTGISNPGNPIDPFNLALQNYGNADYDLRHSLNGNYLVTVPYFGGPRLLTDMWTVGGTLFWHSGFPFSVVDGAVTGDLSSNYGSTVLAAVINPQVPHHCGRGSIINSCFGSDPGAYFADPTGFGGQRRNQFSGPGYFNTDLALLKGFKLPRLESGRVQVGVQAYNILNHPNFQNPGFNFSAPGFGTITQTASSPTSVFGSFLGGDASPRILQLKAVFQF